MVRKHTRRAVKAAFAVAIGIPIILGGNALAGRTATEKVVLGTKNFPEQFILGQLYKQALEAKGFEVDYKENIGSSELVDTAIKSGQINMYPEYTGVIVLNFAHQKSPKTAQATYVAAKKFEEKRGLTLLNKTPFVDADTFTVLTSTAKKYKLKTISDVKKVKKAFRYGGYPECRTRITCLLGLRNIYGLKNLKFVPLGAISVYTLLDQRKIDAGDAFTTEPQLLSKKYTTLKDTKAIFGFQNVAPVVSKKLLAANGSKFASTINAVSAKLTVKAMKTMNKAVIVDKKSPEDVASAFLDANGLK